MYTQLKHQTRTGFTIIELAILLAIVTLLVAIVLPTAGRMRSASMNDVSQANLAIMNVGHILYAGDWNDRQVTWVVDDLASYGGNPATALSNYNNQHGEHPGLALGWCGGGLWGYWLHNLPVNVCVVNPINFTDPCGMWGSFRLSNAYAFHDYIGGRFYEPTFYAPDDEVPYEVVSQFFDEPCEFVPDGSEAYWSSYSLSPAAMYDPGVMRPASEGGWQDPYSYDEGLQSPPVSAALYPSLKTRMIEHHWTDNPPAPCNPAFGDKGTYDGCEPYYFNHGIDAAPLTLFFDGSIRALPNSEVQAWDEFLLARDGDGIWNRTTPLGDQGYYNDVAYDTFVDVSHHILTNDGILGRDTLGPDAPPLARPPRNDSGNLFSTGATRPRR